MKARACSAVSGDTGALTERGGSTSVATLRETSPHLSACPRARRNTARMYCTVRGERPALVRAVIIACTCWGASLLS
jgi:hypothetical protein